MKRVLNDTTNGKPYIGVEIDDTMLRLVLLKHPTHEKHWLAHIDKRVIPQLIEVLQESLEDTNDRTFQTYHNL